MRIIILLFAFIFSNGAVMAGDSAYISFHWNGTNDKPHNGFVFHRKNVAFDPNNLIFGNPFNIYVELSDSSFAALERVLFSRESEKCPKNEYRLRYAYIAAYFNGDEWKRSWMPCSEEDYKFIYRTFLKLLQGTELETDFKIRWADERVRLPIGLRTTGAVALA
jgi:hypothetical protein